MTFLDDPNLTAYALGELEGGEKAAMEARLADDPDARRHVAEIRVLASSLERELRAQPSPLTDARRAAIDRALRIEEDGGAMGAWRGPIPWRQAAALTSVAALVALAVGVTTLRRQEVSSPLERAPIAQGSRPAPSGLDAFQGFTRTGEVSSVATKSAPPQPSPMRAEALHVAGSELQESIAPQSTASDAVRHFEREDRHAVELAKANEVRILTLTAGAASAPAAAVASESRDLGGAAAPLDNLTFSLPGAWDGRSRLDSKPSFETLVEVDALRDREEAVRKSSAAGGGAAAFREIGSADSFGLGFGLGRGDRAQSGERRDLSDLGRATVVYKFDDIESALRGGRAPSPGNESYAPIVDNPFVRVSDEPLSTFSVDVDTASYANVRRFLTQGQLPPRDAVRIEELVNSFTYDGATPSGTDPIGVAVELAECPWNPRSRLAHITIRGRVVPPESRKPMNLVFLVDVSGSMAPENRLPLVQQGLRLLLDELTEDDSVSIVTYASTTRVVLPSTNASDRASIKAALDSLHAGGSTNGGSGIELAYEEAARHFRRDGVNRILLMTDGDFNVGVTDRTQLQRLIEEKAKGGVFLSVLGFGMGNVKDDTMEMLADKGNGNYAYIDSLREARRVLVDQMQSTLVAVAKDVKVQIEFNPARVLGYRLIGYENRRLASRDFHDDRKDAGEIGAGHCVTALYEIVPTGTPDAAEAAADAGTPKLKYRKSEPAPPPAVRPQVDLDTTARELLTLQVRYKEPEGSSSRLLEQVLWDSPTPLAKASEDFRFAAAVASFGMLLRGSPYRGLSTFESVLELAEGAKGKDPLGYRREFIDLVVRARSLSRSAAGK